jgi:hypothetical protein
MTRGQDSNASPSAAQASGRTVVGQAGSVHDVLLGIRPGAVTRTATTEVTR